MAWVGYFIAENYNNNKFEEAYKDYMYKKYYHKKGCLKYNFYLIKAHFIKFREILQLTIKYSLHAIGYTILSQFKMMPFFI